MGATRYAFTWLLMEMGSTPPISFLHMRSHTECRILHVYQYKLLMFQSAARYANCCVVYIVSPLAVMIFRLSFMSGRCSASVAFGTFSPAYLRIHWIVGPLDLVFDFITVRLVLVPCLSCYALVHRTHHRCAVSLLHCVVHIAILNMSCWKHNS